MLCKIILLEIAFHTSCLRSELYQHLFHLAEEDFLLYLSIDTEVTRRALMLYRRQRLLRHPLGRCYLASGSPLSEIVRQTNERRYKSERKNISRACTSSMPNNHSSFAVVCIYKGDIR